MSTVLYRLNEGKVEKELVDAIEVDRLLKSGYAVCEDDFIKKVKKTPVKVVETTKIPDETEPTPDSTKESTGSEVDTGLTDDQIIQKAKDAGIKIGRKGIKRLKKELGL